MISTSSISLFFIKTDKWLRRLSPLSFIGVMALASFLIFIPLMPILHLIPGEMVDEGIEEWNLVFAFVALIIIAPVIETLLCQTLIINICTKYLKLSSWIAVLISAAIFGAGHYSSWDKMAYAFSIGLILAYSFVIYKDKNNFSPSLMVMILHAIRNIPAFIAATLGI